MPRLSDPITRSICISLPPIPDPPSTGFSAAPIIARRVQRRIVEGYRKLLSRLLSRQGGEVSLDDIDYDVVEGCWLIRFQAADSDMVLAVHTAAMAETLDMPNLCGFDAEDRSRDWLRRIEITLNVLLSHQPNTAAPVSEFPPDPHWFGCQN